MPPIAAFVAAGYEHSIANMYFFPVALFHGAHTPTNRTSPGADFLVDNLVPVTLGNIVGGARAGGARLLVRVPPRTAAITS